MLKIVYPICCGMDVHKSFVYACIASTNEQGVTTYKSKRFSTFTKDLRFCAEWLVENNCKDVCMESTGKYWIPVYNILEQTCNVVLAHPKYVKAIKGKKTDKKDAKWIADIFKHDLVSGSFIPPADIRQLRDLVRYRSKLTNFVVGEKNRAQNCLTVSNIKLDDVFSDVFGKASSNIITRMLDNPSEKITDVSDFRKEVGMMKTEYAKNGGFLQRDSVEHEEYAEAYSAECQKVEERDGADLLEKVLDRDNLNRAFKRVPLRLLMTLTPLCKWRTRLTRSISLFSTPSISPARSPVFSMRM